MATALAKGLIHTGVCRAPDITASDVSPEQLEHFGNTTNANVCESNADTVQESDVVILAVKPDHVSEVLESIREVFQTQLLISIAAGVTLEKLERGLPAGSRVVRVMPNTPALGGCGGAAAGRGGAGGVARGPTKREPAGKPRSSFSKVTPAAIEIKSCV